MMAGLGRLGLRMEGGAGGFVAMAVGIVFALVGIATPMVAAYHNHRQGQTIRVDATVMRTGRIGHSGPALWQLTVHYSVDDRGYDSIVSLPLDLLDGATYESGSKVALEVDRQDPSRASLRQTGSLRHGVEVLLLGGVFFAFGYAATRNWDRVQGYRRPVDTAV